ncbi:hypothetical protein OWR29_35425 [Actinoplanes sp. Pm04-4]|uniref:Lipoprotein n=1 Tax=Paractinoplanes pyxinae TaxID=2997416 RepID=A0ABT4B9Y0_9ACTN|nr:hypothetical protein [Actinoplanes pyxinae]MCY1143317.1 hypothetical protein [Actinoplanes pyxinae]
MSGRLAVVLAAAASLAGACGDAETEPQRHISVCVPVTSERPSGAAGRVEIRDSSTVLASASIGAGESFTAEVPAGSAVDVYVDGVLLGGSPEGTGDVSLNCPSSS